MEGRMKIMIEVGPIIANADTRGGVKKIETSIRNDLDGLVRGYFRVGKRNKTVRSRIVESG